MVYRFSWLAGTAGAMLALARLGRLLRPSTGGLPWFIEISAAFLVGTLLTWIILGPAQSSLKVAAAWHLPVALLFIWGAFPALTSLSDLSVELETARTAIRSGSAPVQPTDGLVAILALLFWLLGILLSWGLTRNKPYVAVIAPYVAYLQFSTMDRSGSGWWTVALLALMGFALIAVALDRRLQGTGQFATLSSAEAPARNMRSLAGGVLVVLLVLTLLSTNALASLVPRGGIIDWRVPSSLRGDFYGSVSFNPFVSIHQDLIAETDTPLFQARVEGDIDGQRPYWRLLTLESFDGDQWYTSEPVVRSPDDVDHYEYPEAAFHGPTSEIIQTVEVQLLRQEWLPAAYSPIRLVSDDRYVEGGFRVKIDDASLHFGLRTYTGMQYEVTSLVPVPDLDVLALGADGFPSPLFAQAASEEGDFNIEAGEPPATYLLPNRGTYLALPADIDPDLAALAAAQTSDMATDYERALALEAFFRSPNAFRYSTGIDPGHSASDLSAWLLDPYSPNYRTGYCEQFATSMAVLARLIGIPSRVVLGFSPGVSQPDGSVVVRARNAHAWVELWMPTQGWVRFDPTPRDYTDAPTFASLPFNPYDYLTSLDAGGYFNPLWGHPHYGPGGFTEDPIPELPETETPTADDAVSIPVATIIFWLLLIALLVLLLLAMIPAVKWSRRRVRLHRLAEGDVPAAWREAVDRLTDLDEEPPASATPMEVAKSTETSMLPLAQIYGSIIYGPGEYGRAEVRTASASLRRTERRVAARHSRRERIMSHYRLRSLKRGRWQLAE
jgi:transglutaminase-like putative cysteine protease